ncbi:transcription-repair coupling factor [Desulfurobacterium atlanticum]|uniref:Transcription-repair-coupling factor n=1 Tax=Desulfurobacterium atlanticum TaxID=240169 RepID=A0A238ZRS7_9BACT|nr:transcription-repair coupling factor [Desulfurobacterium atlanticum]SNR85761.1 transcription-repair coupling factor (superfamily II helicase) [Desulfurobacterium atlanticum]
MDERLLKLVTGKLKLKEKVKCSGLPGASKALFIKELLSKINRQVLVITPSEPLAEALYHDLEREKIKTVHFSAWDTSPFDIASPSALSQFKRLHALHRLMEEKVEVVVVSVESLLQKVIPPEELIEVIFEVRKGEEIDRDTLSEFLSSAGFTRVDAEPDEGEFILKGDHLVIQTPEEKISVEFFGDTVEKITVNGKETQSYVLTPIYEMIPDKKKMKPIKDLYPEVYEKHLLFPSISGGEKLLPFIFDLTPITTYLNDFLTVTIETHQCKAIKTDLIKNYENDFRLLKRENIPVADFEDFIESQLPEPEIEIFEKEKCEIDFEISPMPPIDVVEAEEILKSVKNDRIKVIYSTESLKDEIEKLRKKLTLQIEIEKGISSGGYRIKNKNFTFLTETEIFTPVKEKSVFTLTPGELVIHRDYGIGIFKGITSRDIAGKKFDFVEIEYDRGEKLFAPFTQIDRIFPYTGYKGKKPKLDRLGGTSWKNLERRVKASLIKFAQQLAELYKERKTSSGEAIIGDRQLLKEFESAFPFKETEDQLKAIRDVYKDMESEKPMDRLICGDVGFGKTEVAMRAAMKAVSDGKQVALLAPTTILAEQHYRTFKKRFKGFPVKIELISRFKTKKEQKEILEKVKSGEVDILIGTHRITSDDVEFKNLGLLIIDEEHKFGVKTKEKITSLKKNLDVLYLSATPIPRTLYSAISGFRDISVIETPPVGRKGTKVSVMKYSDKVLKTAIERELEREGQIFIVHNDISSLEEIRQKVEAMFPDTPAEIIHGQMRADKVERIMHRFIEGEIKILIATSIIESGIDIPSANTLIVIGAENFGLSQLYQLKGRVGRGVEKGYCYLLTSPKAKLTKDAVKRLEAIKKVSQLGGGFQLALKDLEIRGAGNLLGPQQSGYINSVGLDLYMKLFSEVLEEKEQEKDVKLNVPVEAFIPEDYIQDAKERIKIYSELSTAENPQTLLSKMEELYGPIPDPVVNTFKLFRIKKLAKALGVMELSLTPSGKLILKFGNDINIDPEKLVEFVKEKEATFTPERILYIDCGTSLENVEATLKELKEKTCDKKA